nr:response regulator [Leptotrichiaceae bacterium]
MYNVLFVDDDKYFLEIIERKNVFKNINFVFALNAEEAINILNSKEIAVICSDLRMPETNGIDLL